MSDTAATATPAGEVRDVVIIGSGPSGYTAAIYTARASMKPLIFEGAVTAGGALMQTTEVENFPGFAEGIQGPELMDQMRSQAERFGAELIPDDVIEVDLISNPKVIRTHESTVYAKTVIVSTGSQWRTLGLPGEERLFAHGVSACATCDGFFFRDQDIAVVGGGDSAVEEATFLTRFAKSVTLIHRRDSLRASAIMQERARSNEKIRFMWNTEVDDVLGDTSMSGLASSRQADRGRRRVPLHRPLPRDRPRPTLAALPRQLDMDDEGYITVASPTTITNIPGVFACGDVVDRTYKQAITAAGSGCAAALDAERYIADQEDRHGETPGSPGAAGRRDRGKPRLHPLIRSPPADLLHRFVQASQVFHQQYFINRRNPHGRHPARHRMTRSAPRCSTATSPCWSTSGPSGAGRARWSLRCSRRSPPSTPDTIRIVKLNIDENPEVARKYGIMSIPTMSVFVGGEIHKSIVGAKPKAALLRELEGFV